MFTAERITPFDLCLQRKVRMKRRFSKCFPGVVPAENICGFFTLPVLCLTVWKQARTFPLVFGLESEISELHFDLLTYTFCGT